MDNSLSEKSDKRKIARIKHKIRPLKMKNEKPFSQPPPEILHSIFERAIPSSSLISSSDSLMPNSLWCHVQEQKHAVLAVCRTWYMVGLPFLYEVVSIRRIYQLSHLLRTLKYSSLNLKEMIKKVEVLCITPSCFGQAFEYQLKALFDICTRISSFSYASGSLRRPLAPAIQLTALVPNIAHLELITPLEFKTLQNLLQLASPHVVTLTVAPPTWTWTEPASLDILFRRLEDLTLLGTCSLWPWIHDWKFPRLKCLTFDSELGEERLKEFCSAHGAGLQYLHLTRANYPWEGFWHSKLHNKPRCFPDLSDSCPILQHIVLPPLSEPLIHKSVKWVDVWVSDRTLDEAQTARNSLQSANLPALKGVRLLPYSELEPRLSLPLLLSPILVPTTSDSFAIRLSSDVVIHHDVGEIRWIKPPCAGDLEEDDDDGYSDSDGSFIPDESNSEDSTDYSSDGSADQDWDPVTKRLVVKDWMLMDGLETDFFLAA
ncbi:hypothetical protein GALMADRAFT_132493 [Galerina marginata CBS 339.88]|uniref:F-box domain-containing protein n=1 Tax=Galerina marginata (strain CBS 339.88) TaxID=685588 RepID=A0A067TRJ9_GALM3|nr:hypothetical protein GALMADRAFT_132493 [Galerina marginata CBS 339.88]